MTSKKLRIDSWFPQMYLFTKMSSNELRVRKFVSLVIFVIGVLYLHYSLNSLLGNSLRFL